MSNLAFDPNYIVDRVNLVFTRQDAIWSEAKEEKRGPQELMISLLAPLLASYALVAFIKFSVLGISIPGFGTYRQPFFGGLVYQLAELIVRVVFFFLAAKVIQVVASKFDSQADYGTVFSFLSYASIAGLVSSLAVIVPWIGWLISLVGAVYTLYLLYTGISPMLGVPAEKKVVFSIVSVVCLLVVGLVLGILTTPLMPTPSADFSSSESVNEIQKEFQKAIQQALPKG